MGEYSGYFMRKATSLQPTYNVTAMTYRNHPIYPIVVAGAPVDDDHPAIGIGASAEILYNLRKNGVSATMAWMPFEAACHWLVITIPKDWKERMNCSMDELMQKLSETVYSCKGGAFSPKTIVVNDDIDPTDTAEVIWAFATRNHPIRGIYHRPESRVVSLTAYLSSEEKKAGKTTACIYNCLAPENWTDEDYPSKSSFNRAFPKHIQEQAKDKLIKAGF